MRKAELDKLREFRSMLVKDWKSYTNQGRYSIDINGLNRYIKSLNSLFPELEEPDSQDSMKK
jgi:hypothetical protein